MLLLRNVKGVVSLISFLAYLSFECRKGTDLLELALYLATLLKFFISSKILWWGFGVHLIILSYHQQRVIF